jgi:class 3 adenylate cyclase/tetratricopeptide (TPR) repeat protein
VSTVAEWLRSLGMSEYAQRFCENGIDISVLNHLTDQDLKDIGVLLGHRRKMLAAIRELAGAARTTPTSRAATEPRPRDYAERRQLTVMFCDLVGSTALSERLDPEDLRGVISTYHRRCTDLVERNGGFIATYMGDGVLAYFGYPQALEQDAERAVEAGLALVEAVPTLVTAAGVPLQVRIGIATGLVVVGDLIGTSAALEQAVVGETPNLASRLEALAEPGTVVISLSTHKLTGGLFNYRDLGAVALKGFAEKVQAWQVLGASAAESRFEALRATTTPLVGRSEEIGLLLRRWEQAKGGDGCVVLISGEPGIGKSRVALTVFERLSGEPQTRLRYFCSPYHQDSALYPSITQLERVAGFRRDDTDEQRLTKLEAVVALATNDLSGTVPLLADLLSVPTGDRYPALDLTPQKRKEKTLNALVAQVEGLAARQPALVLFENVHWSDPTTREALDLLIDRVSALRVLVIITFRPEFTPSWVGGPNVTLLSLSRLPARQRAEMITHVASGKLLPKEIADQITDRTDGVPLFIEELTKAVVESGMLEVSGDRYVVTGPVAPLAIPTSLQASLLARLDRLAPTREVAQIAAALGRHFSHELISAVAAMPREQLDDALGQLVRAELIFRRGTPPDAEYTFKHALVQDAAYGTLLRSRRQQLHARIAATLEDHFPEIVAAQPSLLARHCAEGALAEKAVLYWLKAGRQALARSAMREAVAQLRKGLDVLTGVADGPWRRQQELELQIALGPALAFTKGYSAPDVAESIARARTLAEQIDRPEYLVPLLYGQWAFYLVQPDYKRALPLAEQIEKIGAARNNIAAQLQGRRAAGLTCCFLGEFVAARALLEQCHDLAHPAHRGGGAGLSVDPYAAMLASLAVTLAYLGYIDQARLRLSAALSEARRLRHAQTLAYVLLFANWTDSITRSPEMIGHAEELVALSTQHDFPQFLGVATAFRGASLTALGQAQEGLSLLTQGLTAARATGTVQHRAYAFMWLAEAYGMLGRPAEGVNCLAEAERIIETTEERVHEAELHRLQGDLLNAAGDVSAAERNYRQALDIAKRQSAMLVELRASISLARLWRKQSKRGEALDMLAPIYGWFTEGFDAPDLKEAKALIEELT